MILIVYKEVLDFGENLVESQEMGAFAGIWAPFLVFAIGTILVFLRALMSLPRDSINLVPMWLGRLRNALPLSAGPR